MFTRTLYNIYKHLLMMLCLLAVVSCKDDLVTEQQGTDNPLNQDKGIGELVLFSSGSTGTTTADTRASVIPYMEKEGRFVCKMYYHANATDTDESDFDVEATPITSWLRVNDNEGNSVYWKNDFDIDGADKTHQDYLDYGFDSRAQYFYWRNRLYHVFLAYTDYNLLKSNSYALTTDSKGNTIPVTRSLFMYPDADGEKKTKTGTEEIWENESYRKLVFGNVTKPNPDHATWVAAKEIWKNEHTAEEPYPEQEPSKTIEVFALTNVDQTSNYPGGLGYTYLLASSYASSLISPEQKQRTREKILALVDAADFLTDEEKNILKGDLLRDVRTTPVTISGVKYRDEVWEISFNYNAGEAAFETDGSLKLDDSNAVIFCPHQKAKQVDIIATAPANTFDLTRGASMTKMSDQPDPLIALTKMKPMGATQEANRVRLYFKHQFSQIQVNLTNAENTAEIKAENIVSVELLGVTKKGYVFTNINPNGTQIPPTYDPVVITQYSQEQLKENPYGTSFNMFEMDQQDKPQTSLKSFNAIAFGQLQAIRITWKEEDFEDPDTNVMEEGVKHVATYKITVDDRNNSLVNLQSGFRYVYNFELRRGTIAFIRATIEDWLLDDDLDYRTSGTIGNNQ